MMWTEQLLATGDLFWLRMVLSFIIIIIIFVGFELSPLWIDTPTWLGQNW